jgi:hypothetical protein
MTADGYRLVGSLPWSTPGGAESIVVIKLGRHLDEDASGIGQYRNIRNAAMGSPASPETGPVLSTVR